jgi:mannosyl-oligosaccharide alpha-1,2-mannosidase
LGAGVHAAQLAHQAKRYDGRLWFPMVDFETGAVLNTAQSELAGYYAGLLGQVGHKKEGDDYLASFTEMQASFGVIPESIDVATRQPRRKHTGLRPEYADACLNLWLLDRDDRYRALAAIHYREMKTTSRAAFGYTALKDITTKPMTQGDNCPGYWWSEQMKYYYLLFSDTPRIDYAKLQLSTEANVCSARVSQEFQAADTFSRQDNVAPHSTAARVNRRRHPYESELPHACRVNQVMRR